MTDNGYYINLPQQAINYYNQKADELLLKLEPFKEASSPDIIPSSKSHLYSQTIDAKDIDNLSISTIDGLGNIKSEYFDTSKGQVGLSEKNYEECRKIVEELSRKKGLRDRVSYEFVHDTIFTWFSEKYSGHIKQDIQFLSYLSEKMSEVIDEYKIAIPISFLTIQNPFRIGKIVIDFLRNSLFDEYEKKSLESAKDENEMDKIKQGILKIRKKYQGKACATITLKAEKNKAIEIAKIETDNSLSVLQFFSPSALIPEIPNYIARMGQIYIPESHIFIFEEKLPVIKTGIDDGKNPFWHVGKKELSMLNKCGIKSFSDLIIKEELTQLEETCLTSIKYYTKAISSREYHDRLVFILVSIETLLLKDRIESIQENVERRLAVLTDSNNNSHLDVISLLDKAYHHRSSYLHHGETISDMNTLRALQLIIWTAIEKTVHLTTKFNTKDDLIRYLDDRGQKNTA